jgi:Glyoxalase/Bleomycin resistance protein/Dioxygenase superfamily
MKTADQFHVGVVVDDLDATLADLTALFGYRWCPKLEVSTPVLLPDGEATLDLVFTYSTAAPRVEVIQSMPGTLWMPAPTSGIHHLGYWSDDVGADAAALAERGYAAEATGVRPDGTAIWAYHRSASGPRIELVSRDIAEGLQQYWASGPA